MEGAKPAPAHLAPYIDGPVLPHRYTEEGNQIGATILYNKDRFNGAIKR